MARAERGMVEQAMLDEYVKLRHGLGLDAVHLRKRIGPQLRALFGIGETDGDRDVRHKVRRVVEELSASFPSDDRTAISLALGGAPGRQRRLLRDRIILLAAELHCAERTARRRVDQAFERLVDESLAQLAQDRSEPTDDPEKGWYVRRIESLLRLDTAVPELTERRTIVATRDGLDRIAIRFSVPPAGPQRSEPVQMYADVQQGARVEAIEPDGDGHFRLLLILPYPIQYKAEHSYTIRFWLPPGAPMRPHYAVVPLVDCEAVRVLARFDPARPPRIVWRLDRMAPRQLAGRPVLGEPLALDGAYEVQLDFVRLERGYGYGVAWATDDDTE